tara:strand:+ start:333 stop:662 length:330 start_codon:yes stop_codon:yes gene_type:complete
MLVVILLVIIIFAWQIHSAMIWEDPILKGSQQPGQSDRQEIDKEVLYHLYNAHLEETIEVCLAEDGIGYEVIVLDRLNDNIMDNYNEDSYEAAVALAGDLAEDWKEYEH